MPLDVVELDRADAHDVTLAAPARASARSTPILRRRCCTYSIASTLVRSAMATTRSADRPDTRQAPSSSRHDREPLLRRAQHHERLGFGLGGARLADQRAQPAEQHVEALAGDRRDRERVAIARGRLELEGGDVGLGPHDEPGPLEQLGPVAAELVEQHPRLLLGRAAVDRREVEQEHEHPGALDVAEELVARARGLRPRPRSGPGCRRRRTRGRGSAPPRGWAPGW